MGGDAHLKESHFLTGDKAAAATLAGVHRALISSACCVTVYGYKVASISASRTSGLQKMFKKYLNLLTSIGNARTEYLNTLETALLEYECWIA